MNHITVSLLELSRAYREVRDLERISNRCIRLCSVRINEHELMFVRGLDPNLKYRCFVRMAGLSLNRWSYWYEVGSLVPRRRGVKFYTAHKVFRTDFSCSSTPIGQEEMIELVTVWGVKPHINGHYSYFRVPNDSDVVKIII